MARVRQMRREAAGEVQGGAPLSWITVMKIGMSLLLIFRIFVVFNHEKPRIVMEIITEEHLSPG